MFDFVRKHTKIMMGLMFLLIIPSFVLFGIDGYNRMREKGDAVARVGGQDITQGEWDAAHKAEADRLRSQMPNLDAKLLDSPEARYSTLERLVRERVMAQAADQFKLTTSDARLARDLQEDPGIASLRRPDGKLDMERYRQMAASQGMTPEGFEARVRRDLSVRQVEAGLTQTGFAATAVADVALNAFFERREVQVVNFLSADFASRVNPTDAEVEAFYKANGTLFQAPEQASIEYVVLDLESVKKSITINEADLKSYYEQNAARLSGNEERRASHILINAPKDAPAAERQKAKARAQELLAELRKAPDSFADLAKKNSQDPGSAAKGGDLDFFARGAMVKPFEEAAFAMKKGDISELVESDFGYHIIKLADIKAPKQRSFDELRANIEADLKTQQAQRKFAETAEAFTNGVYEQSDSLKPVADKLKLEIKTATKLSRKPAAGVTGLLANAKFLAAIFGPDAIEKKRNTEAIETAPNQLTAGRITQYQAAKTMALADVRANVRERLVASRSAELAAQEGAAKLAAWKAAPASAVMSAAQVLSRDQAQNTPPQILNAVLRADTSKLPVFVGVSMGAQGYAVVKVNQLVARPASTEVAAKQDRAQYAQWWTAAESQAYYGLLKERFKADIMVPRPARAGS
ncbi:MAG: SurA N-terminal domain-containing protein [Comamonadaceae bacterium]